MDHLSSKGTLRLEIKIVFLLASAFEAAAAIKPCAVEVVEKDSGWPVPLVELRTTHRARFVTDNAGRVAFDLPELMGRETWFDVVADGYEVPRDGFGHRGVRLKPEPGQRLKIEVERTIVARRLGRITGGGLFGESQQLGWEKEWRDGEVLGCDSVQVAAYGGRLFWFWGDTTLPGYPLGIFDSLGATTPMKPLSSFEPPIKLSYTYFQGESGAPRGVTKISGEGPTWIVAVARLPARDGKPRLCATYMKIKPPLEPYEMGLCVWNDDQNSFQRLRVVWTKDGSVMKPPQGHAAWWQDDQGAKWVLFGNPFPALRCPATFEAWQDIGQWERLEPPEALKSAADGKGIKPHTGSIAWNEHRQRWVTVFMESFGKPSAFGELWYAEARSPVGPWGKAVKILTHRNYTFYNPRLHQELAPANAPFLIFEGTYTVQFADKPVPTPRYDYNQVLYRLDFDDPRLEAARVE